jgi:cadmium resistance protein CadD (predicted permease)
VAFQGHPSARSPALAAIAVPERWIALLGLVPLALGVRKLWLLGRSGAHDGDGAEASRLQDRERRLEGRALSQTLAVMAVTAANGGDNLSVYIPLFAQDLNLVPLYALVFAVMTAIWCAAGYALVDNRLAGRHLQRYGHIALPFVLVGLGLYILSDLLP